MSNFFALFGLFCQTGPVDSRPLYFEATNTNHKVLHLLPLPLPTPRCADRTLRSSVQIRFASLSIPRPRPVVAVAGLPACLPSRASDACLVVMLVSALAFRAGFAGGIRRPRGPGRPRRGAIRARDVRPRRRGCGHRRRVRRRVGLAKVSERHPAAGGAVHGGRPRGRQPGHGTGAIWAGVRLISSDLSSVDFSSAGSSLLRLRCLPAGLLG